MRAAYPVRMAISLAFASDCDEEPLDAAGPRHVVSRGKDGTGAAMHFIEKVRSENCWHGLVMPVNSSPGGETQTPKDAAFSSPI
jgi:hypothetical protein